jgi:hypothetical protein
MENGPPSKQRALLRNSEGQAVLEYVLMLLMAIGVVTSISLGFKKSLFKIWEIFAQEISAACPRDCAPDSRIKFRTR